MLLFENDYPDILPYLSFPLYLSPLPFFQYNRIGSRYLTTQSPTVFLRKICGNLRRNTENPSKYISEWGLSCEILRKLPQNFVRSEYTFFSIKEGKKCAARLVTEWSLNLVLIRWNRYDEVCKQLIHNITSNNINQYKLILVFRFWALKRICE